MKKHVFEEKTTHMKIIRQLLCHTSNNISIDGERQLSDYLKRNDFKSCELCSESRCSL